MVGCAAVAGLRNWTRNSFSPDWNCSDRIRQNSRESRSVSPSDGNSERSRSPRAVGLFRTVCAGFEMNPKRSGQVPEKVTRYDLWPLRDGQCTPDG